VEQVTAIDTLTNQFRALNLDNKCRISCDGKINTNRSNVTVTAIRLVSYYSNIDAHMGRAHEGGGGADKKHIYTVTTKQFTQISVAAYS